MAPDIPKLIIGPNAVLHTYPLHIGILDVRPADGAPEIVENHIIRIQFRVNNSPILAHRAVSGFLRFSGKGTGEAETPNMMEVVNLQPGQFGEGTVYGIAPPAGQQVPVRIDFYEKDAYPGVEFPPPNWGSSTKVDIAARYELTIDSLRVDETRSLRKDTVFGQATALFGGNPLPNPNKLSPFDTPTTQVLSFGDLGDGAVVPTQFRFGPFTSVPGTSPDVVFNYTFVNSGYAGSGEGELKSVMNWLSDAGAQVATVLVPAGAPIFPLVNEGFKALFKVALAKCDGVVVADQITMRSDLMANLTANGKYSEERFYPGSDSPTGCGANSRYKVTYSIRRLSHFGF